MQQDKFTPEEQQRAEALAFPFKAITAIFNAAFAAASPDHIDEHSYDDADKRMMRDADREEARLAVRYEQRGF